MKGFVTGTLRVCSAFGLKVVPAKAVIAALPDMFNAKQAQTRDAAKILAVRAWMT